MAGKTTAPEPTRAGKERDRDKDGKPGHRLAAKVDRIFGRQIFHAICIPKKKEGRGRDTPVHFVVGHGDVEVFDLSWQKAFYNFAISDAKVEMDDSGLHVVAQTATRQEPAEFWLKHERNDLILNIFQPKERREAEITGASYKPDVEGILKFACGDESTSQERQRFRSFVELQARRRMMFLSSRREICEQLIICICCEFRLRFPQIEEVNWGEAFEVLFHEFVAFIVSLWAQCFTTTLIVPHSGPNSREYFRRLVAGAGALIGRGAEQFKVDWGDFLAATRQYLEEGHSEDLSVRTRELVGKVERNLGQVRKRWILQLIDWFEYVQFFSAAVHIAAGVLEREVKELRVLSDYIGAWCVALLDNKIRSIRNSEFRSALDRLAVETLKQNDALRYGPDFHCTLALWKLAELSKAD